MVEQSVKIDTEDHALEATGHITFLNNSLGCQGDLTIALRGTSILTTPFIGIFPDFREPVAENTLELMLQGLVAEKTILFNGKPWVLHDTDLSKLQREQMYTLWRRAGERIHHGTDTIVLPDLINLNFHTAAFYDLSLTPRLVSG